MKKFLYKTAIALSPAVVFALPQDAEVKHGNAQISLIDASTMQIVSEGSSIIHWNSFGIENGEVARFIQNGTNSAVLNRVMGGDLTRILGSLESNGKVYLINPAGIIIGKEGAINTSGFIASTLDVIDTDFLEGRDLYFSGNSIASVVNQGVIETREGDAFLIGYVVDNQGSIKAPHGVGGLAAGQEVLLRWQGKERIGISVKAMPHVSDGVGAQNSGAIEALQAEVKADGNPYALAINHTGSISTLGIQEKEGRVYICAEGGIAAVNGDIRAQDQLGNGSEVQVLGNYVVVYKNGKIDTSGTKGGGAVFIGGGFQGKDPDLINANDVYFAKGAMVVTDALEIGDAGRVVVWSDGNTIFEGDIFSRGGPDGGDGGFVEVSGKRWMEFDGMVDRYAPNGNNGALLLDPNDITISSAVSLNTASTALNNAALGGTGATPIYIRPTSAVVFSTNVQLSSLTTNLGTGDVIVQTSTTDGTIAASGIGRGDIFWQDSAAASVNTANNLTLQASGDINFWGSYINNGNGSMTLLAAGDLNVTSQPGVNTSSPGVTLNGTGNLQANAKNINVVATAAPVSLLSGTGTTTPTVTLNANGNINVSGSRTSGAAGATVAAAGGTVVMTATNGSITVKGNVANATVTTTGIGAITLSSILGSISVTGGTASGINGSITATGATAGTGNITVNVNQGSLNILGGLSTGVGQIATVGGSLRVNVTDGNVNINGGLTSVSNGQILSTGGGDVDLSVVNGDIVMNGGGSGGGQGSISTTSAGGISLQTEQGNIEIIGGFGAATGNSISNSSGSIDLNAIQGNIQIRSQSTGTPTVVSSSGSILVQAIGGNVEISPGTVAPATAMIEATAGTVRLIASNNCIMQAATGNVGASIRGTTGFVGQVGGNLTLTGGSGTGATTFIRSDRGTMNFSVGGNLNLAGGTGNNSFVQIGSPAPTASGILNMIFSDIGGSVVLTKGTGIGSFALIGLTGASASSTYTGDLTFNRIGGDIFLIEPATSAGGSSYAHIGHISTANTVTMNGNLLLNANGLVRLLAGSNGGTESSIGHGLTADPSGTIYTGQIQMNASRISLIGGGPNSPATIGFFGPDMGSVTSTLISAHSTGSIEINGSNGNAVIGLYNPSANLNSSKINLIEVIADSGNINLTAGFQNAVIGTQAIGATALSNIAISTPGDIVLSSSDDGVSQIVNSTTGQSNPFNISINSASLLLTGGTSIGAASIFSCGNIDIAFNTLMNLNFPSPFVAQSGNASISATGNININTNAISVGQMNLAGGSGLGVTTGISSTSGTIRIGSLANSGVGNLVLGAATATGSANITTSASTGDIFVNAEGDISLASFSAINSARGVFLNAGNNILLSNVTNTVQVLAAAGSITATAGQNISLSGASSISVSGSGDLSLKAGINAFVTSPATVTTNGGNLAIKVGWGDLSFSGVVTQTSGVGNLTLDAADYLIVTGTAQNTGTGNLNAISGSDITLTAGTFSTSSGDIQATSGRDISLADLSSISSSRGAFLDAGRNIFLTSTGPLIQVTAGTGSFSATAGQNISLTGTSRFTVSGTGDLSMVAGINAFVTSPATVTANGGNLSIKVGGGDLTITGIVTQASGIGNLDIDATDFLIVTGTAQNTGTGDLNANAGTDITLTGGTLAAGSGDINATAGRDITLTSGTIWVSSGDLNATAGRDITLSGGHMTVGGSGILNALAHRHINLALSSVMSTVSGELYAIADRNLNLLTSSQILTTGSALVVVVDNLFPDPAKYGTGRLFMDASTIINASGGAVRFYTARQPFNTLLGAINGSAYVAGTQYVNTTEEIWDSYYNRSLEGNPFTVFYKDTNPNITPTPTPTPAVIVVPSENGIEKFLSAINEPFQDWRTYDDFAYSQVTFILGYRCDQLMRNRPTRRSISTCEYVKDSKYLMLRPAYRNYNTKKLDTLY